ncbi:MAG: adenylosuccinate synthase [Myxococcales bacterium]|nr:adenylosuccinate synthase [Myxococcales bacterium]
MTQHNTTVLLGAQWGDEGKGRITDLLAEDADVVVRFSGGHNAGHTIRVGEEKFELHLIPSGILHAEKRNILASGMVISPEALLKEMDGLVSRGLSMDRLFVSARAHVILPYHATLDRLEEERQGAGQIGTTLKGIGPAYTDKVARRGVRMADLLHEDILRKRLEGGLAYTNRLLQGVYGADPVSLDEMMAYIRPFAERLRPYIKDTEALLFARYQAGDKILFEGAQGTLLDLDVGTYPFVTSSYPTAGGVCLGSGLGPANIHEVIGVAKAYVTRVGAGPFPTELLDETGERLRQVGHEFGVTTGRPRRCGWMDLPLLRYAAQVNGLTQLVITKLDVLSGMKTLRLCTHYLLDGERLELPPPCIELWDQLEPVFEEMPGWDEDLHKARQLSELPEAAQHYLKRIEEAIGVPITLVSVGPERSQALRP